MHEMQYCVSVKTRLDDFPIQNNIYLQSVSNNCCVDIYIE